MIDVLRTIVRMKAEDREREGAQQAFELYQQEALGDALCSADELELGDFIDEVDQVQALDPIAVTLMYGIDAHVAGLALRRAMAVSLGRVLLQTVRLAR